MSSGSSRKPLWRRMMDHPATDFLIAGIFVFYAYKFDSVTMGITAGALMVFAFNKVIDNWFERSKDGS
jgi:hypothetical protein